MAARIAVHEVVSAGSGAFVSAHASEAKARAMAERIGAEVAVAHVEVGERVHVRWHGHRKAAEVVAIAAPAKVVVRFVPRAGAAPVERAVPAHEVERRRR